jgi:hypothetical protein
MSRVKKIAYHRYSIKEIIAYLEKRGYSTEVIHPCSNWYIATITGTKVEVDVPRMSYSGQQVLGDIRFHSYPKYDGYEEDEKLYKKLSRTFGMKKGERVEEMKDAEAVQQIIAAHKKEHSVLGKIKNMFIK